MPDVHVLPIELAKRSFQVCGTDRDGAGLFNRTVSRRQPVRPGRLTGPATPEIVVITPPQLRHAMGRDPFSKMALSPRGIGQQLPDHAQSSIKHD